MKRLRSFVGRYVVVVNRVHPVGFLDVLEI